MSWFLPRAAAVLLLLVAVKWVLGRTESAPAEESGVVPAAAPSAPPELPRSFLDACAPLAAPGSGRKTADEKPLAAEDVPRRPAQNVDPASQRLDALRAVDELRARLGRDPRDTAIHRQLGEIYLYALGNRTAAVQHLCRALIEAPTEGSAPERPPRRLDAARRGARARGRAPARPIEACRGATRSRPSVPRPASPNTPQRRGSTKRSARRGSSGPGPRSSASAPRPSWTEPSSSRPWSAGQKGDLRIVVSIPAKERSRVATVGAPAPAGGGEPDGHEKTGVLLTPGFSGRSLVSARGDDAARRVLAALESRIPGRPVVLFARRGTAVMSLALRVIAGTPVQIHVTAFATDPDDPTVRETLIASPADKPKVAPPR